MNNLIFISRHRSGGTYIYSQSVLNYLRSVPLNLIIIDHKSSISFIIKSFADTKLEYVFFNHPSLVYLVLSFLFRK